MFLLMFSSLCPHTHMYILIRCKVFDRGRGVLVLIFALQIYDNFKPL